jgi:hypothetical protein
VVGGVLRMAVIPEGFKKCCHCKQIKPHSTFSPSSVKRRAAQCNECITEIRKERMRANGVIPLSDKHALCRKIIDGIEQQLCSHCNEYKPLSEYPPSAVKQINTWAVCHSCLKVEVKTYRHSKGVKDWSEIAVKRETRDGVDYQGCSECGQMKPLEEFCKNKSCPNGRDRTCKECSSKKYSERKLKAKNLIPLPKAEVITLVCEGCGTTFGILKSVYDLRVKSGYPPKYCSTKCSNHWIRTDTRIQKHNINKLLWKYGTVGGKL